jgi:hypothetical protein
VIDLPTGCIIYFLVPDHPGWVPCDGRPAPEALRPLVGENMPVIPVTEIGGEPAHPLMKDGPRDP